MAIEINYAAYGIKLPEHQHKLDKHYDGDLKRFREDIKSNPYHVLIGICGMSFKYADAIIIRFKHVAPDSYCRCQYAVYDVLKSNELAGNTRMTDAELAEGVYGLAGETMRHVITVVCGDPLIHYEPKRHLVAFERTYRDELLIADHLLERVRRSQGTVSDFANDVEKYRTTPNSDVELTDEQMLALCMVKNSDVCMINGSAGSGKSQTTKSIVNMLDDMDMSYQLLAPTGIASKVLRGYTGRSAMTIHMFLTGAWQPDYIIIDESSMVSVHLLAALLSQVGYEPKLVFIADNAQLSSIQCGSLVQDMIDSGLIPRVELTKIFRYNSSGIVTMATDIRHGNCGHLGDDFPDYLFVPEDESDPLGQVVEQYDRLIAEGYGVDDIVVLCPFKKTAHGTGVINAALSDKYNPNKPVRKNSPLKIGDKVVNLKNCYDEGVDNMIANGDIGYLRNVTYDGKKKEAHVVVEFDCGLRDVHSLSRIEPAMALTVHKIQGGSAKAVILYVGKAYDFFLSSNLLYVGVTRARERLIIVGDAGAIAQGVKVQQNTGRNTWLKEMLSDD